MTAQWEKKLSVVEVYIRGLQSGNAQNEGFPCGVLIYILEKLPI